MREVLATEAARQRALQVQVDTAEASANTARVSAAELHEAETRAATVGK